MYAFDAKADNPFVIDNPPPTISGHLHMGHIFSYCHTDFIARYKRMRGYSVCYPMGFDDNGVPTENLIEKKHKMKAKDAQSRKAFIDLCERTSCEDQLKFTDLFTDIGLSVDWNLSYSTNTRLARQISQLSFIDLYNKGLIYRKEAPCLWDCKHNTAIAQADVVEKESSTTMYYINFHDCDNVPFAIATTRPEMMPACVAVLYHPDDERYRGIKGDLTIPHFNVTVPVVQDENVVIDKGTGLVMCCTFGDELDLKWHLKHNFETKSIITGFGKLYDVEKYVSDGGIASSMNGLGIESARKYVAECMKPHTVRSEEIIHHVKCSERSDAKLELIMSKQWFIKIVEHKDALLQRVDEIVWHPAHMKSKIINWIEGVKWDWCISRQRSIGVPIPVWYSHSDPNAVILPDIDQLPCDPRSSSSSGDLYPDCDVMDTWATSALTPHIHNYIAANCATRPGIVNCNPDIADFSFESSDVVGNDVDLANNFLPADLRTQAHEIIRTWAFYTIAKAHLHSNTIPWRNILISGWCMAENKTKMSKSKGNTIDPLSVLGQYGADAVRYWASTASLGADTVFSDNMLKIGRRLNVKLWNAAKFVHSMTRYDNTDDGCVSCVTDVIMLSALRTCVYDATVHMEVMDYCSARGCIEKFFWQYCDYYLELVKDRAYNKDRKWHSSAIKALKFSMSVINRLFAPFLPYITEEVQHICFSYDSVHGQNQWPDMDEFVKIMHNSEVSQNGDGLHPWRDTIEIISKVRACKASRGMSIKDTLGSQITITTRNTSLQLIEDDLCNALCIVDVKWDFEQSDHDVAMIAIQDD